MDQFQQAGLAADAPQVEVQPRVRRRHRITGAGLFLRLLLPRQIVLFGRADGPVTQSLGVVAGHHQLHRGEELLDEIQLLIVQVLPDALGHVCATPLQFQRCQRDAVDVQHHVRPLVVPAGDRHLFGDREVVPLRPLPVDQSDGPGLLPPGLPHLDAVSEQVIHVSIHVVQIAGAVPGERRQFVDRAVGERLPVPLRLRQERAKQIRFDVAIVRTVGPVAEVAIAEFVSKQGDDAVLRNPLTLADDGGGGIHMMRVSPLRSDRMSDCFKHRVLASLLCIERVDSSGPIASISASTSPSTAAIAFCSASGGSSISSCSRSRR